jgi:hypothetical protein
MGPGVLNTHLDEYCQGPWDLGLIPGIPGGVLLMHMTETTLKA